jgi:bifunctional non-homologous end joining protein LigD
MRMINPMLAKVMPDGHDLHRYIIEPKYDGIRCIAYDSQLINRSMVDVTARFPEIKQPYRGAVLDGEIVCFNAQGVPDFQMIQRRMNRQFDIVEQARLYPATFVAFDLLEQNSLNLLQTPLWRRKAYLNAMVDLTLAPAATGYSEAYVEALVASGWEGAMAKRDESLYRPGSRTLDWLKIKLRKQTVVTVHGLTPGIGHRSNLFGAMICAADGNHIGDVGTGFTDDEAADMLDIFEECRSNTPTLPFYHGPVLMWCIPVVKIRVSYIEITNAGQLRHPSFISLANI